MSRITHTRPVFQKTLLAATLASLACSAIAQEKELGPIVVSASGFEQAVKDAPASISVITADELKKKSYTDLTDALKHVAGVQIAGGGVEQSIRIRGMTADYTLFLIDGRPLQGNDAFGLNGGQAGTPVNFLPPLEAIERIEIIRGPASALYGSDAMGGVVNVITKKVNNTFSGSITSEYMTPGSGNQLNEAGYTTSLNLNVPLIQDRLALQLNGSVQHQEESNFVGGSDSAASDPRYDKKSINGKLSWAINEQNTLTLGAGHTVQERNHTPGKSLAATTTQSGTYRNGNVNSKPVETIDGAEYVYWAGNDANQAGYYKVTDTVTNASGTVTKYWDANNTGSFSKSILDNFFITHEGRFGDLQVNSYINYDTSENPSRVNANTGNGIDFDVLTLNTQATYFAGDHTLTGGLTRKEESLKDGATNGLQPPIVPVADAVVEMERYQNSVFLEDNWSLTDNLMLTLSGRLDDNQKFGSHFSPKVYAVYHLTESFTIKGGVTTGYKAPSLRSSATDFGSTSMGGVIIGNPELKPETSLNREIGFGYESHDLGLLTTLTAYVTDYEDKINRTGRLTSEAGDNGCKAAADNPNQDPCVYKGKTYPYHQYGYTAYENVDKAELRGIEWTFDYSIQDNLTYRHSYTYTDTEQKSGEHKGKPLNDMAKHSFNAAIDWQVNPMWNLWTQYNYRGETSGRWQTGTSGSSTNGVTYPAYSFVDAGVVFKPSKDLMLKAGVYNVANKKVTTDDDYAYNLDGRRFIVGLTKSF